MRGEESELQGVEEGTRVFVAAKFIWADLGGGRNGDTTSSAAGQCELDCCRERFKLCYAYNTVINSRCRLRQRIELLRGR